MGLILRGRDFGGRGLDEPRGRRFISFRYYYYLFRWLPILAQSYTDHDPRSQPLLARSTSGLF